jgi:hypothetical protein
MTEKNSPSGGVSLRRHMPMLIRRETLARLVDDYSLSALRGILCGRGRRIRSPQPRRAVFRRWSQGPHEDLGAEKGEESPIASPNTGVSNPPDRLQPIREAEPIGLEAPVSEPAMPIAADEEPSAPAPAVGAVAAADTTDSLVDGQVRYALQEQPTPPSPPRADDAEAADGPIGDAPEIEHAQPDHRFGRALVAGRPLSGPPSPSSLSSFCFATRLSRPCRTRPVSID